MVTEQLAIPRLGVALRRGLRKRCPRCGEGRLFRRGIDTFERCSFCQLQFERDAGDTWMFTIITDRIPILFGIAALYFGFRTTNWMIATVFFAVLIAPILLTIRERQGLALALSYLSRVYMPDPSDEVVGYGARSSDDRPLPDDAAQRGAGTRQR